MAAKEKKAQEKVKVTFEVPLDCMSCVEKVNKQMAFEKGVKDLKCDLANKTVTVTYRKDQTDIEKLREGFAKIGYKNLKIHETTM